MSKTYTVFDEQTGEIKGRGLSHEETVALVAGVERDREAEADGCFDMVFKIIPQSLCGVADSQFDELAAMAARIGWPAVAARIKPHDENKRS
jgi:hypothetical protein